MKPYSTIKQTLLEYAAVAKKDAPVFQELPTDKMSPDAEYNSYRFNIKKHQNGNTGMFTIHDKESGKHVGTISYNKRPTKSNNEHILAEITKSPECKHQKMMSEVIAHLHDNAGHKMFSSTTLSGAGLSVWRHLAATHNVHAVDDSSGKMKAIAKNLKPEDLEKHAERKPADKASKQFYLGDSK